MYEVKIFHNKVSSDLKKLNIESKFTIVKKLNYKPKYIFVCVVFRLEDPYRDESTYKNGLVQLLNAIPRIADNFGLRIYFDNSLLGKDDKWNDLYKYLTKVETTELIHYDFPDFKNNVIFHKGLFGTLIRAIPLFKFSNIKETVINIDIDINYDSGKFEWMLDDILNMIRNVKDRSNNGLIINAYTLGFSNDSGRLDLKHLNNNDIDFNIRFIMNMLCYTRKIDKNLFLNFMKCMISTNCIEYKQWIGEIIRSEKCNSSNINKTDKTTCDNARLSHYNNKVLFLYGIDEYLLNTIAYKLTENGMNFGFLYNLTTLVHYHYNLYESFYKKGKISENFMLKFYKFVLKNECNNDNYKNYQKIDNFFATIVNFRVRPVDYSKIIFFKKHHYFRNIYTFLKRSINDGELENELGSNRRSVLYFKLLDIFPYDYFFINQSNIYNTKLFR